MLRSATKITRRPERPLVVRDQQWWNQLCLHLDDVIYASVPIACWFGRYMTNTNHFRVLDLCEAARSNAGGICSSEEGSPQTLQLCGDVRHSNFIHHGDAHPLTSILAVQSCDILLQTSGLVRHHHPRRFYADVSLSLDMLAEHQKTHWKFHKSKCSPSLW